MSLDGSLSDHIVISMYAENSFEEKYSLLGMYARNSVGQNDPGY